jgi:hypothetical protein
VRCSGVPNYGPLNGGKGCPLVRQAGGEVALLEGDGRLAPAQPSIRAVTSYLEVGPA